jgi:hypothetical protein
MKCKRLQLLYVQFFSALGTEPRALWVLDKFFYTELHPQPCVIVWTVRVILPILDSSWKKKRLSSMKLPLGFEMEFHQSYELIAQWQAAFHPGQGIPPFSQLWFHTYSQNLLFVPFDIVSWRLFLGLLTVSWLNPTRATWSSQISSVFVICWLLFLEMRNFIYLLILAALGLNLVSRHSYHWSQPRLLYFA